MAVKFIEMLSAADTLGSLTQATRADTANGGQGPTFADTQIKIDRLLDYISENNIYGDEPLLVDGDIIKPNLDVAQGEMTDEEYKEEIRKALRDSKIPMLQAFHTLGLESQRQFVEKFFPHFRNDFTYILDSLRSMTYRN